MRKPKMALTPTQYQFSQLHGMSMAVAKVDLARAAGFAGLVTVGILELEALLWDFDAEVEKFRQVVA
ncbi:hypothetical protein SEA_CEPENS_46 [Mycobacterium phage Cepens]|nr:hypothetical protein SEA_ARGIE_47 [Mycobacterium phage Argie]QBP32710.1 hypothetical protein SEA_CEPENS_46 [Mycobacterium phage Cepens]